MIVVALNKEKKIGKINGSKLYQFHVEISDRHATFA